jgi:hypothetical protein
MKLVSRKEARELGLKRYYTGIPCKRGHVVERIVSTLACLECHKLKSAARTQAGLSRISCAKYYKANRKKLNQQSQEYYRINKTVLNEKHAARDRLKGYSANRRAAKLGATPPWTNKEAIRRVYALRPDGYHVDHIVPLIGKNVCGLHIADNLQYLPALDNLRKSNKVIF